MASQESKSNRENIFVFCKDWSEFLIYKQEFPNENCEFLTDISTLRGRSLSRVIRYGRYEERWDYQGVEDEIDIAEAIWKIEREEKNSAEEGEILDYGLGE